MTCPVELTDRAVRDLDALYPEKRGRIRDRELYSYLKLFWARDGNVSFVSRRMSRACGPPPPMSAQ
jgi:hypothetical protein